MNTAPLRWLGVAFVLAGVGVAIWAGPVVATALPAIFLALLGVVLVALISIGPHVRLPKPTAPEFEVDALVSLRAAFREGMLGRQKIVQAIAELQRAARGREASGTADPVLLHPESVTDRRFREWVAERLAELEAST